MSKDESTEIYLKICSHQEPHNPQLLPGLISLTAEAEF